MYENTLTFVENKGSVIINSAQPLRSRGFVNNRYCTTFHFPSHSHPKCYLLFHKQDLKVRVISGLIPHRLTYLHHNM